MRAALADERVLYLIWRGALDDGRATPTSPPRSPRFGWSTLPAVEGGETGALSRSTGMRPGSAGVERDAAVHRAPTASARRISAPRSRAWLRARRCWSMARWCRGTVAVAARPALADGAAAGWREPGAQAGAFPRLCERVLHSFGVGMAKRIAYEAVARQAQGFVAGDRRRHAGGAGDFENSGRRGRDSWERCRRRHRPPARRCGRCSVRAGRPWRPGSRPNCAWASTRRNSSSASARETRRHDPASIHAQCLERGVAEHPQREHRVGVEHEGGRQGALCEGGLVTSRSG